MGDGGPPASNSNTKSTPPPPSRAANSEHPHGTFEVHPDEDGEEGEAFYMHYEHDEF